MLQVILKPTESDSALWTLGSMSFGLMLATIVSAVQKQLTFYNAIQVQNLVW